MAQSKITLIGLEKYLNPERSVFDDLVLPEGIDKEILVGSILMRCQEFELLWSDPDFMIDAVNIWSRKYYWTFERWVKVLNEKYDPLYNKDYYEEITDTHSGDYSKEGSGSNSGSNSTSEDFTRTDNLTEADDHTRTDNITRTDDLTRTDNLSTTNDNTQTHSEKAYNSNGYVGTTQDVTDQDGSQTGTVKNTGTVKDTGTVRNAGTVTNTGTVRNAGGSSGSYSDTNSNDESGTDSYENKHMYHGYGNIGITSAQELVLKELDVARHNMYDHIADLFASEFCIMVY